MSELKVPKSRWVLNKNFFKVTLHADFKHLWPLWLQECQLYEFCDDEQAFVDKVTAQSEVYIYQFPSDRDCSDESADYFEKIDDNYVIPRHLFTVI